MPFGGNTTGRAQILFPIAARHKDIILIFLCDLNFRDESIRVTLGSPCAMTGNAGSKQVADHVSHDATKEQSQARIGGRRRCLLRCSSRRLTRNQRHQGWRLVIVAAVRVGGRLLRRAATVSQKSNGKQPALCDGTTISLSPRVYLQRPREQVAHVVGDGGSASNQ